MAMAASSEHNLLVEQSYSNIISTVRSMPLNYNIVETPFSMYLTVRKSLIKSAQISATPETLVEKFKKMEEANQILKTDVEEALKFKYQLTFISIDSLFDCVQFVTM